MIFCQNEKGCAIIESMDDRSYNTPSNNVEPTGGMPGGGVAMSNSGTMVNGSAMANGSAMPVGGTMSGTGMPNGGGIYSGGMMPGNGPISSGTGDIVLKNGGGGKSKKGLIIGVIVGVLVIVGVVVGVVMMNGGGIFGGSGLSTSNSSLEEKFNIYANYLVSGEPSKEPLEDDYNENVLYYFMRDTNGDDVSYFENLNEAWDSFLDLYSADKKYFDNVSLASSVETQSILMDFFNSYNTVGELNNEKVLGLYLEKGKDGAINTITEEYNMLNKSNYSRAQDYVEATIEMGKVLLDIVELYSVNGCVVENGFNYACTIKVVLPEELGQRFANVMRNSNLRVPNDVKTLLVRNCWVIANDIRTVNDGTSTYEMEIEDE